MLAKKLCSVERFTKDVFAMSAIAKEMKKNEFFQLYRTINTASALNKPVAVNGSYKKFPYPTIGIYCGHGASHSWLWFVDILDEMGFWDIEFVDEHYLTQHSLHNLDVLLVSGGDTFAIAESLGAAGSQKLKSFLEHGGLYIGSCAGAYLPLTSSLPPLNHFNYVSAKIGNLTKTLPTPRTLPEKFCTPYGCNYVFHPVREEVKIKLLDFPCRNHYQVEVCAPLYGGPVFLPSDDVSPRAHYVDFTPKTVFLTDFQLAYDTMIGNSAIVTKHIGNGQMYLLGPHLEHPHWHAANTLIAEMIYHGTINKEKTFSPPGSEQSPHQKKIGILLRDIKAEVSNSRIVALSLERESLQWQIGSKVYEPEKIRVFLEAMWSRWNTVVAQNAGNESELYAMFTMSKTLTLLLRAIKHYSISGVDATASVREMFDLLKKLTASFLTIYFKERRASITNGGIP